MATVTFFAIAITQHVQCGGYCFMIGAELCASTWLLPILTLACVTGVIFEKWMTDGCVECCRVSGYHLTHRYIIAKSEPAGVGTRIQLRWDDRGSLVQFKQSYARWLACVRSRACGNVCFSCIHISISLLQVSWAHTRNHHPHQRPHCERLTRSRSGWLRRLVPAFRIRFRNHPLPIERTAPVLIKFYSGVLIVKCVIYIAYLADMCAFARSLVYCWRDSRL